MTSSTDNLEKLKDLIISHVAKDVLLLGESVDELKSLTQETKALLEQVNNASVGYFDNMSSKLIQLLNEMEVELRKTGEARVNQISLNISDNVDKILNDKFSAYKSNIDNALDNFNSVNKKAIENLNSSFNSASDAINEFKNPANLSKDKSKAIYILGGIQCLTLIAVALNFII